MAVLTPMAGTWRYIRRKLTSRLICAMTCSVCAMTLVVVRLWAITDPGIQTEPQMRPRAFDRVDDIFSDWIQVGMADRMSIISDDAAANSTFYQLQSLRDEQKARIKALREECRNRQAEIFGLSSEKWAYGRIEVSRENRYLYCPLLKVGSTFFRRLFFAMQSKTSLKSPYEVGIERALQAKRSVLGEILPLGSKQTMEFLKNATSIMFVREPFSRLLSGYTDKLFAPNPYFWKEVGNYVISKFRNTHTGKEQGNKRICGHDVTFAEFVRYVVDSELTNETHRDAHFTPTYDQCKPCSLNYTIIGKMETFKPDVAFTLSELGYNISKEQLSEWAREATLDAIMDSSVSPWGWRRWITRCMTWEEALKRIWRKLQIRGFLLLENKFPWSSEEVNKLTSVNVFTETVKRLYFQADKSLLSQQKLSLLTEAFATVPKSDLAKLVELFAPDFKLFQYSPRPNFIFDQEFVEQHKNRNWIFDLDTV